MKTRTYLCPTCDGWGRIQLNETRDPQNDFDVDCEACDSSGVNEATHAEGEDRKLIPWHGHLGRVVEGLRAAKRERDPLLAMAADRAKTHPLADRFYYGIYRMRAMRPVAGLAQADMLANATRCVTAVEKLRATEYDAGMAREAA